VPEPAVSIVIPAHAPDGEWLRQCVRSCLVESSCSVEVVVVDDGSPQPVADLLSGTGDERLRLVRIDHGGVAAARNAGFQAAGGRFIRFVDADDVAAPGSTGRLLALAERDDGGAIACGATRWCDEELAPVLDWVASCPRRAARSYLLLRSTPMLPSILFPRRVAEEAGPWDAEIAVSEDWDFILRAFELAPVQETRSVMTWYRRHDRSASRDRDAAWRGTQLAVSRYLERNPEARERRSRRQIDAMLDYLAAELTAPAAPWRKRRFWRALRRDPLCVHTAYVRIVQPRLGRLKVSLARSKPVGH
jgi:glycosyltransferase involved in cell wall biosynthesis